MSHRQHHHGPHPEDARLFGPSALPRLQRAATEVAWLLSRGYPMSLAVATVGNHHQLETRQRLALQRTCCADAQRESRLARALSPAAISGQTLRIDGFNLLITLEVALGGGVLLAGREGALRDLAGLRGSYRPVEETDTALALVGEHLALLQPARCEWYLDEAVSNSGRLRARIADHAAHWTTVTEVHLVPDPDPILSQCETVVSSDALILDHCRSWANLTAWIVDARIPSAWRVALDPPA